MFVSLIGDGKFLKSIYCKCDEGSLIVKIYRKFDPNESLSSAEVALRRLSLAFTTENQPNLLPYADYQLSAKFNVAFMVRQYFASNLYDRICSRPFLTAIEKKWIAFQILRALEQCHSKGICHGDIKQENIMVTSWNWIFLTDFAPFKPTYIPEDDPADYNYYFCAIDATRRGCSVAPERFYGKATSTASTNSGVSSSAGAGTNAKGPDAIMLSRLADSEITVEDVEKQMMAIGNATSASASSYPSSVPRSRREGNLLESMDIFSAGCVIAEIFLGGKPLFDLPLLLKYRTGDHEHLRTALRKIDDPQLEELLLHMLQLDPRARLSASEYLARYSGDSSTSLFPSYFENFLFRFLVLVLSRGGKIPDARVRLVCKYYGRIVREVAGVEDPEGEQFFKHRLREGYGSDRQLNSEILGLDEEDGHVAQRVLEELEQKFPAVVTSSKDKGLLDEDSNSSSSDQVKEREREMLLSTTAQKKKIEKLNEQYQALTEKKKQALTSDVPRIEAGKDSDIRISEDNDSRDSDQIDDLDGEAINEPAQPKRPSKSSTRKNASLPKPSMNPLHIERNGIVVILSLVCSSLRHVQVPESKITALYLIRYLGQYTTDEVRLQRLVPFLLELVDDASARVRALSIRVTTFLLSLVQTVPLSDSSVFPQYIFPLVAKFPLDSEELVRITFAECLPLLASTSRRFLEIAHSMKQRVVSAPPSSVTSATPRTAPSSMSSGAITSSSAQSIPLSKGGVDQATHFLASSNFDKELNRLHKVVSRFVIQLAAPDQKTSSSLVKRALLVNITQLCIFFGRERTLDVVLPQLITFLNDRDWELRGAFFEHITGVCAFVGRVTVELYILPCIEQALFDVHEIVITKALECLGALCQLGLFQKSTSALTEKAKMTCSLLLHPSWWIRDAVLKLMSFIAVQMGSVDANVFLGPLLRPFLTKSMVFLIGEKEEQILHRLRDCCRPFVSRETFDAALIASSSPPDVLETSSDADADNELEIDADFVTLTREDSDERIRDGSDIRNGRRGRRDVLSSVDSLDNYSVGRLPPPIPTQVTSMHPSNSNTSAYEHKKNEMQALKLMQQYVAIASMHMRSKMELAHSEQTARMQSSSQRGGPSDRSSPMSGSLGGVRKLPRSQLHVLYVPDMRFALSVAQPLRGNSAILNSIPAPSSNSSAMSTALVPSGGSTSKQARSRAMTGQPAGMLLENMSLSLIVRMYGLVAPNLPLAAMPMSPPSSGTSASSPFDDSTGNVNGHHMQVASALETTAYASSSGAMVSLLNMNMRDMYGGDGAGGIVDHHTPVSPSRQRVLKKPIAAFFHPSMFRESSIDPALTNPRKLLARLTALGVPPLPPDLGALRLGDGAPFAIYAHPSSPYSAMQNNVMIMGASSASASPGSERGGIALSPSAAAGSAGFNYGAGTASAPTSTGSNVGGLASPGGLGGSGGFGTAAFSAAYRNWRPRKNILVAELAEHSGAVNRIGAAQDYSFLASASNDGTVKLWSIGKSMQHSVNQGSRCTYDGQGGVLTDMIVLDNCHSVASASSNGTVHVFRADRVSGSKESNYHASAVREIRCQDSAVMVLDHLNNVTESLLIYATRSGSIHAWDLRTRREAWRLDVSPELGYVTCMTHSMDVSWLAAGTSRGFICLWDLRFLVLIRIWRHSSLRSIHRLKPCLGLPNTLALEEASVPLVFVAAGDGEVAVFDLSIGACRAVFRTLHVQAPDADACRCPTLQHIPIPHRNRSVLGSFLGIYGIAAAFDEVATTPLSEEPSVRAILCPSLHFRGVADALITGGEDKQIRYWDIRNGKQSFTVCGDGESKSFYDNQSAPSDWWRINSSSGAGYAGASNDRNDQLVSAATLSSAPSSNSSISGPSSSSTSTPSKPEMAWSKLSPPIITICQDASYFAAQGGIGAVLAAGGGVESAVTMERRGLVPPSPAHNDCILDLALVDLNGPLLVSSGRDGIIKVWK
ncbi:hypothetical protein PINS_up014747 [Pythium insidiosum]|nr:hypothetical protein PINS_up014747 [Pythium insidiosum]